MRVCKLFCTDTHNRKHESLAVMERHNKDCYYDDDDESTTKEEKTDRVLCEYHNWYHAIACSHSVFMLLSVGEADRYLEKTEIFACLMGALIHDLDHPGTNNDFETKRETSLAARYENDAVLERHSISETFVLCEDDPELDWLSSFRDEKTRNHIQRFLTESVLATDPARHASIVNKALAHSRQDCHFDIESVEDRLFICGLVLHCADISNPSHPVFAVAADWAIRVTTEFSRQAKKERALGLDVAEFMEGLDSQYKIAKLQIGFFRFMVKPLFKTVAKLFPNLNEPFLVAFVQFLSERRWDFITHPLRHVRTEVHMPKGLNPCGQKLVVLGLATRHTVPALQDAYDPSGACLVCDLAANVRDAS
ncbi:hypothetical protein THAOC_13536, partial [Thalassiosira oceanica]